MTGTSSLPARVTLNRRYRFSASHRLHVPQKTDEQNRELFGKCNNPHGHGHNYTLQVTVEGPVSPETGMIVDLQKLDGFVQREVLERFHFANLNADPAFSAVPPSTENLVTIFWDLLTTFAAGHAPLRLQRVRVEETNHNAFDFFGEAAAMRSRDQPGKERKALDDR